MSRRNQASRRRSYGRRQHELRQRRQAPGEPPIDWFDELSPPRFDSHAEIDQRGESDRPGQAAA